ncbi:MAG TPA: CpaF family protein, partial [Marmoricola sp.]
MEPRPRGRDHTLLRELQVRVGDRLEKEITGRARNGKPRMSPEDEEVMKAELARQVVTEHVREVAEDLHGTMRWEDAEDLIDALKSLLYGAGSLDALLREERIEEIVMNSWDKVFCYYIDGTKARVAPVYASNEEMIEAIQTLAA